jgi:hypothetical protein
VRQRRIQLIAIGAGLLVVVGLALWLGGSDEPADVVTPSQSVATGTSAMMVFSVTEGPESYVAVVGSGGGRDPASVVLEPALTVVAPGQGDRSIQELSEGDGASLRTAVSNAIGAWAARYGVIELDALGAVVEREGGLTVNLPDAYTIGGQTLGPGEVPMDAGQVVALLRQEADDGPLRFIAVLDALLASGATVQQADFADSDDPAGAAAILGTAGGALAELAPAEVVAGTVTVPSQPEFDEMMGTLFGIGTPVRAIVQNGSGQPGVGEDAAEALIPAGFRIVISENAEDFSHQQTEITANGEEHQDAAELARERLGVGTVVVSDVSSGFADVTIVIGKDFAG